MSDVNDVDAEMGTLECQSHECCQDVPVAEQGTDVVKKPRGRPRKVKVDDNGVPPVKRPRGRPKKVVVDQPTSEEGA